MNGLSGSAYYGSQYQSADTQRSADGYNPPAGIGISGHNSMQNGMILGGQSLDEIINQNNQEMQRRRTFQSPYRAPVSQEAHARRASMMEFGAPLSTDLADFQFDPNPAASSMEQQFPSFPTTQKALDPRKVRSRENLAVDTRFSDMNTTYAVYANSAPYASNLMPGTSDGLDSMSQFAPPSMNYSMDFENVSGEATPMTTHQNPYPQALFTESPMDHNFPLSYADSMDDPGGANPRNEEQELIGKIPHMSMADPRPDIEGHQDLPVPESATSIQDPNPTGAESATQEPGARRQSIKEDQNTFNQPGNIANPPEFETGRPTKFANAYSSSGFDMLKVLLRVASRQNPEINIGPVDLSCAFVVCDIQKHDLPIVYCSDVFERLTGYSKYEILGRNCRFLQSPDGKVQAGVKRKYVDDNSIMKLKNKINKRSESQITLINYRKGGQPFMNLLTVIPVSWDTDELRYYVGFQVDLVEQPNSVRAKNPDGSYAINYQRGQFPRYVLQPPDTNNIQPEIGQTIGRDEVSSVLSTIGSGESDLTKRIWDKVLLENTDDVVHVLSLKGLFLYLSPACRKVLEYDASELVGTALSSVCHPSDIVPVTRELKETSTGAPVNVVFRIRRKHSGYTWFESHGCLHTEQGKGRKCIILVGRQRPVYALAKSEITTDGEIGESELWAKISTSGMFLYVSSNAKTLLDRSPEDLIGTSIQALMRLESKKDFGRSLEQARVGRKAIVKHDLQHRRGHVLQVQTSIYPGDAEKGQKPTFLVLQTRFVKMTRASLLSQKPNPAASPRTDQASVGSANSSPNKSGDSRQPLSRTSSTPLSSRSFSGDNAITTAAGGEGLALGNQDEALASEDNIFDELKTTRSTSWQFELRQMEKQNRLLAEELQGLLSRKKKRKRRKGMGQMEKDCANCHTRVTPEWRRGPSGNRDLCNSCGLRWAKQNGRVSPRKYSDNSDGQSASPLQSSQSQVDDRTPVQTGTGKGSAASPLVSLKPKTDQQTSPRPLGNRPPKIDEGQEPPHNSVLPT